MTTVGKRRIMVLGYGNPARRDDGLGPALAEAIDALHLPEVMVEEAYQLNIEDAVTLSEYDEALFLDAAVSGDGPFQFRKATPAETITFSSHSVSPESVLAICEENFSPAPEAWVLAILSYDFSLGEGLTPEAEENLEAALDFVQTRIRGWRT